jgi:hypothetical protein
MQNTETVCPILDAETREDMELCALDALRLDGKPATPAELHDRYGFTAGQVAAHAEPAIAAAARRHQADQRFHFARPARHRITP